MKNQFFAIVFLTAVSAAAAPIYDLGLPCEPAVMGECSYNYSTSWSATTTQGGNEYNSTPGRITESRWSHTTTDNQQYWENASVKSGGWWQAIGGYGSVEVSSYGFSDDYRYGDNWWESFFSTGSYYSLAQSGWGLILSSDWTTITYTAFGWGDFQESWYNYFGHTGGSSWPGGSSAFENINQRSGSNSNFWNNQTSETYTDPNRPTGDVPEPATLLLISAGLVGIGYLRRKS